MSAVSSIYLAPCSNSTARSHLQRMVVSEVPREKYGQYTGRNYGASVGIWGLVEGNRGSWKQITPGDYLFFYTGDETYQYAAQVLGTEYNPELGEALWPNYDEESVGGGDPMDPWHQLIYLGPAAEVDLDSAWLHGEAGYGINHIVGFQSLNDHGHEALIERFGGIDEFVRKRGEKVVPRSGSEAATGSDEIGDDAASDVSTPTRTVTKVNRVVRDTAMATRIKRRYDYTCQVCGAQRQRGDSPYAEAHHIHPLGADPPGPDTEGNLLVLCPNHHADFDYGQIAVDPDTYELSHAYERAVDGGNLTLEHHLDRDALLYHNEQIATVEIG